MDINGQKCTTGHNGQQWTGFTKSTSVNFHSLKSIPSIPSNQVHSCPLSSAAISFTDTDSVFVSSLIPDGCTPVPFLPQETEEDSHIRTLYQNNIIDDKGYLICSKHCSLGLDQNIIEQIRKDFNPSSVIAFGNQISQLSQN